VNAAAKTMQRRKAADRHYDQAARTVLAMAGALISLIGAALAIGGYLSLNGSAFHMFVGMGLVVTGTLVAKRHRAGACTYLVVFCGTLAWSLRNVAVGSGLAQRLAGPMLLLVMMAVLLPLLGWRLRQTVVLFGLLVAGTVGLGILSLPNGPLGPHTAAVTQFLDAETKGVLQ
jgi:quinoprotein glucose dehydrogenase